MSFRFMLFAAWCFLVFAGTSAAAYYAWSPFADGKRGSSGGYSGSRHK